MKSGRWLVGLLVGMGAALFVVGLVLKSSAPTGAAAPLVGHPAPDFALADTSGHRRELSAEHGHIVLVNFWATWCVPCRSEMPLISRLYARQRAAFTVLAVDKQEPLGDVRSFQHDAHLAFAPVLDQSGSVFSAYRVSVQPESFWVDATGVIRAIHYGPMSQRYIERQLQALQIG